MYIASLPTKIINNKQASFKIPLSNNGYTSATTATTLFYSDTNEHQSLTITNNTFPLDKLVIRIVDNRILPLVIISNS